VNELTDLPDEPAAANQANARMRREGTRNLLEAARAAGASRFVSQSVAWRLDDDAGAAVAELERLVLAAEGVVLRYGRLYGPGTYYEDDVPEPPRIHVDEAARRTVPALDAESGIVELTED
jgi:nucleoside-diphosphate-sugar epimerase